MSDQPTTRILLHGTNRTFGRFDLAKCRTVLNDDYQGDGLCFTDDLDIAWSYAHAARNANIDRAQAYAGVERTLAAHPALVALFRDIVEIGYGPAWDRLLETHDIRDVLAQAEAAGIDADLVGDVAAWVEGSRSARGADGMQEVMNFLHARADGLPDWVVRDAARLGIDCEPRVVVAEVSWTRLLDTDDREAARTAFARGYDAVRYTGGGTVRGRPEYMVCDPSQAAVLDVVRPAPDPDDAPDDAPDAPRPFR